jgi:hypothetical protein
VPGPVEGKESSTVFDMAVVSQGKFQQVELSRSSWVVPVRVCSVQPLVVCFLYWRGVSKCGYRFLCYDFTLYNKCFHPLKCIRIMIPDWA